MEAIRSRVVLVLGLLPLVGCAAVEDQWARLTAPTEEVADAAPAVPPPVSIPRPPARPIPASRPESTEPESTQDTPAAPTLPEIAEDLTSVEELAVNPAPRPEPLPLDRILGADGVGVLTLLGPPDRRIEQSPATLWVYQEIGCTLTIRFFRDLETGGDRALAINLDGRNDPVTEDVEACLAQIRERTATGFTSASG